MAISVWTELVCARCATTSEGVFTSDGRAPVKRLKDYARKRGWRFTRDDAFCSQSCEDLEQGA